MSRAAVLFTCVVVLAASAQAALARVDGPSRVGPGQKVTFGLTGMHAGSVLTVRLQRVPCDDVKYGCGGRAIYGARSTDGAYRSDAEGRATVAFRWPRRYQRCVSPSSPHTCRYYRWRAGERVRFSVCDASQVGPCQQRVVRIRLR